MHFQDHFSFYESKIFKDCSANNTVPSGHTPINANSLCLGGWYMFDQEILKNVPDLQHLLIL